MEPSSEGAKCFLAESTRLEHVLANVSSSAPRKCGAGGATGRLRLARGSGGRSRSPFVGKAILTYSEDAIQK